MAFPLESNKKLNPNPSAHLSPDLSSGTWLLLALAVFMR